MNLPDTYDNIKSWSTYPKNHILEEIRSVLQKELESEDLVPTEFSLRLSRNVESPIILDVTDKSLKFDRDLLVIFVERTKENKEGKSFPTNMKNILSYMKKMEDESGGVKFKLLFADEKLKGEFRSSPESEWTMFILSSPIIPFQRIYDGLYRSSCLPGSQLLLELLSGHSVSNLTPDISSGMFPIKSEAYLMSLNESQRSAVRNVVQTILDADTEGDDNYN